MLDSVIPETNQEFDIDPHTHREMEGQILYPNEPLLMEEYKQGKETGESCHIPLMAPHFAWKRGFVNTWAGWPNFGKSAITKFITLVKVVKSNWKAVLFVPEDLSSAKRNGKVIVNSNDVFDSLVFMLTGKPPYLHYQKKWGRMQIPEKEYKEALRWLGERIYVVRPKGRDLRSLMELYRYIYEYKGTDILFIDPFKNLRNEDNKRSDLYIDDIFAEMKDTAIETDSVFNLVAHPHKEKMTIESGKDRGKYKKVTPDMLLGGASFNNNTDGFYSIHRPNIHLDYNDPQVMFINYKQRKSELVAKKGAVDDIRYSPKYHRFYFEGVCPLDGSKLEGYGKETPTGTDEPGPAPF